MKLILVCGRFCWEPFLASPKNTSDLPFLL
jgi:hypothetical protein